MHENWVQNAKHVRATRDLLNISLKFGSKIWRFRYSLNQAVQKCRALLVMYALFSVSCIMLPLARMEP